MSLFSRKPDPSQIEAVNKRFFSLEATRSKLLGMKIEAFVKAEVSNDQALAAALRDEIHTTLDILLDTIHEHADQCRKS